MDTGLKAAITAAGSSRKLARHLGISHQSIAQWNQIPAKHIIKIEMVTGVTRERLRPDLYRKPKQGNY